MYNQDMLRGWARLPVVLAFLCGIILGVMGFPPQQQRAEFPLRIDDGRVTLNRVGVLILPAYVWLGDDADIRFMIERGGEGDSFEGWIVSARLENLSTPEAREEFREPLVAGQPVSLRWTEEVKDRSTWQARLRLEVIPVDQTGKQGEGYVLLIRRIQLPVRSWLGLPASWWRGGAGIGLGICLIGWIWAVRRKGSHQSMLQ